MKCPDCGSVMILIERLDDNKYAKDESPYSNLCQNCGHEEKVRLPSVNQSGGKP